MSLLAYSLTPPVSTECLLVRHSTLHHNFNLLLLNIVPQHHNSGITIALDFIYSRQVASSLFDLHFIEDVKSQTLLSIEWV